MLKDLRDSRGLECFSEFVLELPPVVDGEDPADGDANCRVGPHVLQMRGAANTGELFTFL